MSRTNSRRPRSQSHSHEKRFSKIPCKVYPDSLHTPSRCGFTSPEVRYTQGGIRTLKGGLRSVLYPCKIRIFVV